jgi:hypothetical protein
LLARDIEPFRDLVNASPSFEILENGRHGNASIPQYPRAAEAVRDAFDGWALGPIQHELYISRLLHEGDLGEVGIIDSTPCWWN